MVVGSHYIDRIRSSPQIFPDFFEQVSTKVLRPRASSLHDNVINNQEPLAHDVQPSVVIDGNSDLFLSAIT